MDAGSEEYEREVLEEREAGGVCGGSGGRSVVCGGSEDGDEIAVNGGSVGESKDGRMVEDGGWVVAARRGEKLDEGETGVEGTRCVKLGDVVVAPSGSDVLLAVSVAKRTMQNVTSRTERGA